MELLLLHAPFLTAHYLRPAPAQAAQNNISVSQSPTQRLSHVAEADIEDMSGLEDYKFAQEAQMHLA